MNAPAGAAGMPPDPPRDMEAPFDPDHPRDAVPARSHYSIATLSDRTRALTTVPRPGPPPPPRSRPLLLSNSLIEVQLRKSLQGLSDPADDSCYLPPSQLLKGKFKSVQTKDVRSHHLSWDVLYTMVYQHLGIDVDLRRDEFGWMQVSRLGTRYISITDELTFHNAMGVLHNTSALESGSLITIYLWSPRPEDPFFRRSRRAPDLSPARDDNKRGVTRSQESRVHQSIALSCSPDGSPLVLEPSQDKPASARHGLPPGEEGTPKEKTSLPSFGEKDPFEPASPDKHRSPSLSGEGTSPSLSHHEIEIDVSKLLLQEARRDIEAPEKEEDEDDADFEARLAEYKKQLADNEIIRLQYELDSQVCEHLDEEVWQKVCAFFHHDPNLKHAEYVVKIKGFGRKLLPTQAHSAMWALSRCDDVHGSAIIGLIMGLGKTTLAYAIHCLRHMLNCMHDDIMHRPQSHCKKGCSPGTRCPVNDKMRRDYGLDCPCAPESPTHFTKPCFGFSLVIAPLSVLKVWMDEGAACFPDADNTYQIQVMKAHGANLSRDQLRLLEADRDEKQLDDDGTPVVPALYPTLDNSRCIIITTSHSFESKVQRALTRTDRDVTYPPPTRYVNRNGTSCTRRSQPVTKESPPFFLAFISQVFRDELHMEKNAGSKTIAVLQQIRRLAQGNRDEPPHLMPMSGTPLTTGPSDLSHYIKAMVRPAWAQHPVLRHWMKDRAIKLGKAWEGLCRTGSVSPEDSRNCVMQFRPLVEELMVRFTDKSNFLGTGPVVKVPRCVFVHVLCTHTEYWQRRLAEQKADEDGEIRAQEERRRRRYQHAHHGDMKGYQPLQQNRPNSYYRARLYASFPYLMDLRDKDGEPLRLTEEEWVRQVKEEVWKQETMSDPYYANREKIFASSAKLAEIEKIWNRFKGFQDAEEELARLVFCSYFFTASYIMYLFFRYRLGVDKAALVFINKTMSQKRIDQGIETFRDGVSESAPKPRVLIATTSSFGVGQTISQAIGLGLLESDYRPATNSQAFGRHTRQGNKNLKTYTWVFRAANNGVEERIEQVNEMRGRIMAATQAKVRRDDVIDLTTSVEA